MIASLELPRLTHLRGFTLLVSGQALARAVTFVAITYLARVLGVEMFGVVGFAAAVASYALVTVDSGLDLIAMREIAEGASIEGAVSSIIASRLVLAVIASALLCLFALWLAPSPVESAVILASALTLFSFASNLRWAFQALERNALVAATLALSQIAYLIGVALAVHGPGDVIKVPLL